VVVVEHDMEFVRRLDCKVTVLHEGSVLAEGSLDHVTANQGRHRRLSGALKMLKSKTSPCITARQILYGCRSGGEPGR
jgi:ABC-type methionine transport system ATPase subunit